MIDLKRRREGRVPKYAEVESPTHFLSLALHGIAKKNLFLLRVDYVCSGLPNLLFPELAMFVKIQ